MPAPRTTAVIAKETGDAFDLLTDLVCIASPNGTCGYFNKAWQRFAPNHPDQFVAHNWIDWVDQADRPHISQLWIHALATSTPFEADVRIRHPLEGSRWFLLQAVPRTGSNGEDKLWLLVLTDIHQRKLRELDLEQRRQSKADMLNASEDCIKLITLDGRLIHMNQAGCAALGVAQGSSFGMDWLSLLPEEVQQAGREALAAAAGGQNAQFSGKSRSVGGNPLYWNNLLTPILNTDGEVEKILCVSRNVTAAHSSEQRIDLLVRELNHRAKNTLAVMQALIRRTVPDPNAEFVGILETRITSIARSQDLLINGQWIGARVHDVVVTQTSAAGDVNEGRIVVDGDPKLNLVPKAAETLGLAISELTTNALKYGALSNANGVVKISWRIEDGAEGKTLNIEWREHGGPEVAPPSRKGFGTVVTQRNPEAALNASVSMRYDVNGVIWKFAAPVETVLAPDSDASLDANGKKPA